jgi:hypothetical protein
MTANYEDLTGSTKAEDIVLLKAIIETADRIVTSCMTEVHGLRDRGHVLRKPAFLFTESLIAFGEEPELEKTDTEACVREILSLPQWIGLTESQVADVLLREEASVFRILLMAAATAGAIKALGQHGDRSQLLFEKLSEFAALAGDLMYCEV